MKFINICKNEILIVYGTGLIITIFAWIFFSIGGYPFINTAFETLDVTTPPLYMISIFFPYGILIGELLYFLDKNHKKLVQYLFFIECLIVGFLSFARLFSKFPVSGHATIIFFFLLHQIFNNHSQHILRIIFGLFILIITIIYKFIFWNDPITFSFGVVLGSLLWLPGFFIRHRINVGIVKFKYQ